MTNSARRNLLKTAALLALAPGLAIAQSAPLTILVIRHGEKPNEAFPGPGLTQEGVPNSKSLVIRGWQRAGAWAALFAADPAHPDFPRPQRIYGSKPNFDPDKEASARPYLTALPIADRLGLKVNASHAVGEEAALAQEIEALSGVVLISWEHVMIGKQLLPSLLRDQPLTWPRQWPEARYDLAIRLDRAAPGAPWTFRQLFPRLLSGDTDQPI